jgi:transitional endoplasmic reticulum ATPase
MSSRQATDGFMGTLVRVATVDTSTDTMHFRLADGRTGRSTGFTNLESVHRGDVLIISDHGWERAASDVWPEPNTAAVVNAVLEDGSVLIDAAISIKVIANASGLEVRSGNTVEYNDMDGVLRVVSESPIRSGGRGEASTLEDVKNEYLWTGDNLGDGFSDFGGYPEVKERARELIETQLERRSNLDAIKARPVRGVLFSGPPGTGKTHLARIIARESKADFYLISGPAIVSKWVGDTEDTLRKIFEAATSSASGRAIIFFDEIDSIAERRGGDSHESSRRLVAQFLTLMDGFDDNGKSVIIIAATNRVDALDPALTRPGRFDWEIQFGYPDVQDRLEILEARARRLTTIGELPLEDVAMLTEGWSAADLTAIWTEAALVAAADNRSAISAEDVAAALDRVASKPRRAR